MSPQLTASAGALHGVTPDPSDGSLLRRLQSGEEDAATKLFLRYSHRVRALARAKSARGLAVRVDADDIVQSVFRTFFRRAVKGEYDVPRGEDLWRLFLVIGLNKVRAAGEHHSAAKRNLRITAGEIELANQPSSEEGEDAVALSILQMSIDQVLDGLPAEHRQIVELRIEGYEVSEIAQRVARAKRSVERILQEFRAMLCTLLDE